MRHIVVALLLATFSQFANSEGVIRLPNGNMIVFKDTPCENVKVLSHIRPEHHKVFRQAAVLWGGKGYAACWTPTGETVFVADETGDSGEIPLKVITFDERV